MDRANGLIVSRNIDGLSGLFGESIRERRY